MRRVKKGIRQLLAVKPDEKIIFSLWGILILLRLPSIFEPYWYGDEAIYLVIGRGIKKGLTLYKDLYDNKTPLIYWLAALGNNVAGFRLILLAWMIFTTYNFYHLAKKITSTKSLANILGLLFVIITSIPLIEGNIANSEIFIIGFSIWAVKIIVDQQTLKRFFSSGVILGLGFLTKVVALLDFGTVALWVIAISLKNSRHKTTKNLARAGARAIYIGVGFFLIITACLVWFWHQGALSEFVKDAFLQNAGYLSSWSGKSTGPFWKSHILKRAFLSGSAALIIVGLYLKNIIKNQFFVLGLIWIPLGLFSVTLSERPYPHYLIQLIPGGLIVFAGLFEEIKNNKKIKTVPLILVGLTMAITLMIIKNFHFYSYPSVSYYKNFISWSLKRKSTTDYYHYFDSQTPETYKIAKLVNETTEKKDNIFVWGDKPFIYALTKRLPPTRYTVSYHIIELNETNRVFQDLVNSPPELIIYFKNKKPDFKKLDQLINQNYFLLKKDDQVLIWKRLNSVK